MADFVHTLLRPESVIGEFGWLWCRDMPVGPDWVLIHTTDDDDGGLIADMIGQMETDGTRDAVAAEKLAGRPYMDLARPAATPGEVDRLRAGQHPVRQSMIATNLRRSEMTRTKTPPFLIRASLGLYHYCDGWQVAGPHERLSGEVSGLVGDVSGLVGDVSGIDGNVTDIEGDVNGLRGNVTGIWGNVSGLRGNVTGIEGDVTGIWGDVNEIPLSERPCNIADYVLPD